MAQKLLIRQNDQNANVITQLSSGDIQKVDVVDVDITLLAKDGTQIVLPDAGMASMGAEPPTVIFKDKSISVDALFASVSATLHSVDSSTIITSADPEAAKGKVSEKEMKEAVEKAVKEEAKDAEAKAKAAEAKSEAEHKQHQEDQQHQQQTASLTTNTESTVENME